MAEDGAPTTADREPRTGDRGPRTDDRGPQTLRLSEAALASAVWTPTTRTQIAWDVRAELAAARELPAPLTAALRAIEDGRVDRDAANRVFFQLATAVCPGLRIDVATAAERIRAMTPAQLDAALVELTPISRSEPVAPSSDAVLALGREALAAVIAASLPATSAAPLTSADVLGAGPFVLGSVARELGLERGALFVDHLRQASAPERASIGARLQVRATELTAIREALGERSSGAPLTVEDVRRVARAPEEDPALAAQARRLGGLVGRLSGAAPEAGALLVRERQRAASHHLTQILTRLRDAAPALTDRAASGLDAGPTLAAVADLISGGAVHTNLESRAPLTGNAAVLLERLAQRALRARGDDLAAALGGRPELAPIAELIGGDAPHAREVRAGVLRFMSGLEPAPGETLAAYTLRVAAAPLADVMQRLAAELAQDRAGLLADLSSFVAEKRELEAAARHEVSANATREMELARGELRLSADLVRSMRAHVLRELPNEALGYLAAAGDTLVYLPVRNELAGAPLGEIMGVEVAADSARVGELVAALGLSLVAKVHSHPDAAPVPSHEDLHGMRSVVALFPGLRTLIFGVKGSSVSVASFASDVDGQLVREDNVHVC